MTREVAPTQSFDLVTASLQSGLSASFPKSRSAAYAPAVAISKGAAGYQESGIEGGLIHFVSFAGTREDMARALALLTTLRGYKGLLVYAGGKLLDWSRAIRVLQCYADAAVCDDPRAHCIVSVHRDSVTSRADWHVPSIDITPDFMKATADGKAMLFPCRLLAMTYGFKIQAGHPSTEGDQIQAGAVREGCAWCPNFRSNLG